MKKWFEPSKVVVFGVAAALVLVNGLALHKESVLARGRQVFVELAPVDPRSLIEGDYMRLDYAIDRWRQMPAPDGKLIAKLDERKVAHFDHFGEVPLGPDEVVLQYKTRRGRARIGADAFYFEEGQDQHFAAAKFGELRVMGNGQSVLVGLRDAELKPL
jgi:uncharacterized membrane-anchored protein